MRIESKKVLRIIGTLAFIGAVALACSVRFAALSIPLERDEGEYAYSGQLLLEGIPPFIQSYNMKFPGIYIAYAACMKVFGQSTVGIRCGAMVCMLVTAIGIFMLARVLFGHAGGCVAALAFAIFSFSPAMLGFSANAEHFVNVFTVWGCFFLVKAIAAVQSDRKAAFIAGILLGTAVLMKQHAAMFALFGFFSITVVVSMGGTSGLGKRFVALLLYGTGLALPFSVMCLWLIHSGAFSKFWFWTFVYAKWYVSQVPFGAGMKLFSTTFGRIVAAQPLLWILVIAGMLSCKTIGIEKGLFLSGLFICSFAAVCPGFLFREHYFLMLMPAAALLAGLGTEAIASGAGNRAAYSGFREIVMAAAVVGMCVSAYAGEQKLYFEKSPDEISRFIYGGNPFPESCVIADSIRCWTGPDDKIAVIGSEPQICFYAHRKSATGFMYTYALMEEHPFARKMQEEMISEIESNRPPYMVFVNVSTSWLVRKKSSRRIFEWFDEYQRKWYKSIGVVDIISPEYTEYRWNDQTAHYVPRSSLWCAVFKRKPSEGKNGIFADPGPKIK